MKVRTLFLGSGAFAVKIFQRLQELEYIDLVGVVTQPDKPVGRKGELGATELGEFLKTIGYPESKILKPEKIKLESEAILAEFKPELVVVASYGQIIPSVMLETPKYKCLNIHGSILPELRGAVPVQMAILKGLEKTGVTLQVMSQGMDEGDIVGISEINISKNHTSETLMDDLSILGAELLEEVLPKYLDGSLKTIPQENEKATYCYKEDLSKEKAEITPEKSVIETDRMIRAFNPWPISWLKNKQGKIVQIYAAKHTDMMFTLPALTLIRYGKDLYLQLKDGSLLLEEVKLEGKNKMKSPDYLFLAEEHVKE
jgi:methionyl-tRNA formyltransferase